MLYLCGMAADNWNAIPINRDINRSLYVGVQMRWGAWRTMNRSRESTMSIRNSSTVNLEKSFHPRKTQKTLKIFKELS